MTALQEATLEKDVQMASKTEQNENVRVATTPFLMMARLRVDHALPSYARSTFDAYI